MRYHADISAEEYAALEEGYEQGRAAQVRPCSRRHLAPGEVAVDPRNPDPAMVERGRDALERHQFEWIGEEEGYDCGCNEYGDQGPWHTLREVTEHQTRAVLAALAAPEDTP